jgi:hypothetical protein
VIDVCGCTVEKRGEKVYVKDSLGVVALRREDGTWIDAFGGVFQADEIETLNELAEEVE